MSNKLEKSKWIAKGNFSFEKEVPHLIRKVELFQQHLLKDTVNMEQTFSAKFCIVRNTTASRY